MKKILLSALLLVPFADAQNSRLIQLLDYDEETEIKVYCINEYAFAELSAKKAGGALTQIHDSRGPMKCSKYLKDYREAVWKNKDESWD